MRMRSITGVSHWPTRNFSTMGPIFSSARSWADEKIGPIVEKFLVGQCDTPVIDRMRILRLVENLTLGAVHALGAIADRRGAGSPQAQRIMIARQSNIDHKKDLAKALAGVGKPWDKGKTKAPTAVPAD